MFVPTEFHLKILLLGGVGVLFILALFTILFFFVYQKRLYTAQIHLKELENDYQRQLLSSSIAAQEKERSRIGQDLHDQIGSTLSAIKMLAGQIKTHDEENKNLVSNITHELTNTITDVRHTANNLFPSILSKFGFINALQHLGTLLSAGSDVAVNLFTDETYDLSFDYELAIYRIIQELANNALRHANPSTLDISLHRIDNELRLTVVDNGCGFDANRATVLEQSGIGLKSIRARVAIMQAQLKITSDPGRGTKVEIIIP
jgi:signal transduction histidine kinase